MLNMFDIESWSSKGGDVAENGYPFAALIYSNEINLSFKTSLIS